MADPVQDAGDPLDGYTPLDEVDPKPPPGRSLPVAIATALVLVTLLAVFYLLGRGGFLVLICLVVLLAQFELLDALAQKGRKPLIAFGLAGGLAMILIAYSERPELYAAVLVVVTFGSLLLSLRPTRGPNSAGDAAWTVMSVVWVAGGGAGATSIMMLAGGLRLLVAFILTAALDDICAYFVGTRLGRHKMAPRISPGKSWEGFSGGVVGALVGGVGFMSIAGLEPLHGLAVGVICAAMVPAGDLVESLFKREMAIKDSGRLLPGHGGMLDRLDAIMFAAPFVFLYLRFVAL